MSKILNVFQLNWMVIASLSMMISSTIACTRPETNSNANISISVPQNLVSNKMAQKIGALSVGTNDQLVHVVINATGEGISAPILLQWDRNNFATAGSTSLSFTLDIPTGKSRLFQVLAVYQNKVSNEMSFYYGDSTKDLIASEEQVSVAISQLGSAQSVVTGRVSGRILTDSPSVGPSGVVEIRYNPGNGKPSLLIERDLILNGWFSFFMLSGINLSYVVAETGFDLFGGAVSLDSAQFDQGMHVMKVATPISVRKQNYDGSPTYFWQEPTIAIWGFWSQTPANITNAVVCNNLSSVVFQNVFQYTDPPASANTLLTIFPVPTSSAFPSNSDLLSSSTALNHVYHRGGDAVAAGYCNGQLIPTPSDISKFYEIKRGHIDGNGNDNLAGFRGFLVQPSPGSNAITLQPGTNSSAVSGQLLPDLYNITSSIVFYKFVSTNVSGSFHIEHPDCDKIAAGEFGFVPAGTVSQPEIVSNGTFTGAINVTSSETASGKVAVVACPVVNGKVAKFGVFAEVGGGSVGQAYLKLKNASGVNSTQTAGMGSCAGPIAVERFLAGGSPDYSATALTVNLNFQTLSGVTLFENANDCIWNQNPISMSTITIPASTSGTKFFYKSTASNQSNTVDITASNFSSSSITINTTSSPTGFPTFGMDAVAPYNQISAVQTFAFSNGQATGETPSIITFPMSLSSSQYVMVRFTNNATGSNPNISNLYATNGSGPNFMFSTGFPGGAGTCLSYAQTLGTAQACTARVVIISPGISTGTFTGPITVSWTDDFGSILEYTVNLSAVSL